MIAGDPSVFAVESGITEAYDNRSLLALGFFVIHLGGSCYGRQSPDSTMLGCSLDAVKKRIAERGKHTTPFAGTLGAGEIVSAFRNAIYADTQHKEYFGVPVTEFCDLFHTSSKDCMWAPDGDEAFDDGSFVLQFDVGDCVRLIAFRSGEGSEYDVTTLRDVWLSADVFYGTLQLWQSTFEAECAAMPK